MVRSLLCVCLVVPVLGMLDQPAGAAGNKAQVKKALKKVKGKIYLTMDVLGKATLKELAVKFADKKPSLTLEQNTGETWSATMVAFMSRRPNRGPITLWFYDRDDLSKPIETRSVDRRKASMLHVHDMLLDGDLGYKMCRVYVIHVGQILRGKNKVYATGEVVTDPNSPKCKAKKQKKKQNK